MPLQGDTGVIRDSEILRVESGRRSRQPPRPPYRAESALSGQYAVSAGTRLSDVIKAPGALGTSPYTLFGIIVRKDPRTLLRSLVAFTPVAVMGGTEDLQLQSDDVIRPITVGEVPAFGVRCGVDSLTSWRWTRAISAIH